MCDSDDLNPVKLVESIVAPMTSGVEETFNKGMDYITPDMSYLQEEADRVRTAEQAKELQMKIDRAKINSLFGVGDSPAADQNKSAREKTLSGIYDDILGDYNFELDKQFERKDADVKSMLADRGISRSSAGQSIYDRLGEVYDKQEANFEEGASAAITNIRDADEDTRINLIDMINTGGDYDNARENAYSNLTTNINTNRDQAQTRDLTKLFAEMDELYGQKQYVDAYNQGQQYGSTNLVTPGSTSSGSSGQQINF